MAFVRNFKLGLSIFCLMLSINLVACGGDTPVADVTSGDTTVSNDTVTPPVDTTVVNDIPVADPCDPNPCLNGGSCADDGAGNASCSCIDGYTGNTCETAPAIDPCDPNPCLNGGSCADDGAGNAACTCIDGFTGDTCETAPPVDPCDPNPCMNGGSCADDGAGNAACTCVDEYTGDTCEIAPLIDPCDPNPCLNDGICTDDGANNAVCACADGYEGPLCADVILDDIIVTATGAGDFATLLAALEATNYTETLKGDGPFTVFAPTDAAFLLLPEGMPQDVSGFETLAVEQVADVLQILKYHAAVGEKMAADIVGITELMMVNGRKITIEVVDGGVVLNGLVNVTLTDIECSNGVIHVIDAVLIPPPLVCEAEGSLCDAGTPDVDGLTCVPGAGGQGFCANSCTDDDLSNCPGGQTCLSDATGAGFCGPETCTGFFTDDCGPGAHCIVLGGNGSCYPAGPTAEGEVCTDLLECQQGLICTDVCEVPACSADNLQICQNENEFCSFYEINLQQGTFAFDVGECSEGCNTFIDDSFCAEGEHCVADWQNPLWGQCELLSVNPVAPGEACDGTISCTPDHLCADNICQPICAVGQVFGEIGGCGSGEFCNALNAGGQALQVGLCDSTCDYHDGIGCVAEDEFCNPLEFSGLNTDLCFSKPEFWGVPGDTCPGDLVDYSYCAEGSFCVEGICTQACFLSEGPFGAEHPECDGQSCDDILGGGVLFGVCQ